MPHCLVGPATAQKHDLMCSFDTRQHLCLPPFKRRQDLGTLAAQECTASKTPESTACRSKSTSRVHCVQACFTINCQV